MVNDNLFRKSDGTAQRVTLWRCSFLCSVGSVFMSRRGVPPKHTSYLVTTEGEVDGLGTCKPKGHIRFLTLLMNSSNLQISATKQVPRHWFLLPWRPEYRSKVLQV